MTRWVALLRAVNVGGTSKLSTADLRAMCEAAGSADVRTYTYCPSNRSRATALLAVIATLVVATAIGFVVILPKGSAV